MINRCYICLNKVDPIKNIRELTLNYKGRYEVYTVSLDVPEHEVLQAITDLLKKEVDAQNIATN